MAGFADQISKALRSFEQDLEQAQRSATRAGLREGIKEYKRLATPYIPKLANSTRFRRSGALQRKFKASIRLDKDKQGGKASLYFSKKGSKPVLLKRKRVGVTRNGKRLTGDIKAYKNDAFYWFMVDQGTDRMAGRNYRLRAKSAGQGTAEQKLWQTYKQVMQEKMQRWK